MDRQPKRRPTAAAAQGAERLAKATAALEELVKTPDDAIPQHILDRAEAVVVIPTLVKGGFIVGAEHGRGVISVRDRSTGSWSAPAFVAMTGGSVGWQIGVQSTDLVLLVMNRDGVDDLLNREGCDVLRRVVRAQQARGLTHVRRAEPCAGAVAHAGVERDAHDRNAGLGNVFDTGQLGEGGDPCVARREARVDGTLWLMRAHGAHSSLVAQ